MNKNFIILSTLLISGLAFSQVGVNTLDPKSTVDITAKNTTGTTTNAEGLLVPRVDRQRAQSMTNVENSTLIYVDDVVTGGQTGTAANIDAVGYYYFNRSANAWIKMHSPDGSAIVDTHLYNADGTLSGHRTVIQDANRLAFTGSATNAFSVDGTTLSVDAANNRVGIGTTNPVGILEITSDNVGNTHQNDFYFNGYGTSKGPGIFLQSSGGTKAVPEDLTNGDNIGGLYFNGRAGAGNVVSNITSYYRGDGATRLSDMSFATSGAERIRIKEDGNVGIGTSAPAEKLDVRGGLTFTGQSSVNKTAFGGLDHTTGGTVAPQTRLLSWGPDATTSGVISFWTGVGGAATSEKMRIHSTGNVGIGTNNPNPQAILDLSSTTQGFLPPRMTTVQRDQITTPVAEGLMIYNTTANMMQYHNGTTWVNYN